MKYATSNVNIESNCWKQVENGTKVTLHGLLKASRGCLVDCVYTGHQTCRSPKM